MMSGFQAKLATTILVVFLVVDTCALPPNGCEKRLSRVGIISRKTFPGKEGSLGCQNVVISVEKKVAFRDLKSIIRRSIVLRPPPPPAVNRASTYKSLAPPPQIL